MKTPLDHWKASETHQTEAEKFFESDAGHWLILAMQQQNLPSPAYSQENQMGFQRFIDTIPTMFRTAQVLAEKQQDAYKRAREKTQLRPEKSNE